MNYREEGWDPPPVHIRPEAEWRQQFHLRFTPSGLVERRNLGVVLCPGHGRLERARVRAEQVDGNEVAYIGDDVVTLGQGNRVEYAGAQSGALIALRVGGRRYEVRDEGLSAG